MREPFFETVDLSVGYDGVPLIRDIALSLDRGEILTLIGPNGAGKTTILKSLTRHLRALRGDVRVAGDSLFRLSAADAAKRLSVVLTERIRGEYLTAFDVAASGRYPYTGRFGTLTAADLQKTADALADVGASALAECRFDRLSDGERQRILLARAVCQEPELIVLDEPTSYLDLRFQLELLRLLQRLARTQGITVILSLHELELARKISDRVLCVRGETVFRFGAPGEIFRPEVIEALYDLPPGSWDPFSGVSELPRPEGVPQLFVISGCGTGTDTFRALQRAGTPFYAGILFTNDLDYPAAKSLASEVFSCAPFAPVPEEVFRRARSALLRCRSVIDTGVPIGEGNRALALLIDAAKERGILRDNIM